MSKKVILSGMRPTGKLHIGHWVGALSNWVSLQEDYSCYFMVANWHAYMSEYKNSSIVKQFCLDNLADWLAYGVDPAKSTIFVQSDITEHLDLYMILSFITPLGWLSRCPTFKEQIHQLKDKEVNTYAFLGYPALQAADIVLYGANCVPVGEDQLPHLELCREIVRRFHHIYKKEVFIEPQPLLTKESRLLGLDGRKMSKSYQNYIALDEEDEVLEKKVLSMMTDPARVKKTDPGHPDICNVYTYHCVFRPEAKDEVADWCVNATNGCRNCKQVLSDSLKEFITPKREEKKKLLKNKKYLEGIIEEGNKKARVVASKTLDSVKEVMGM